MKYRHEWKHEISRGDMLVLRQRLSAVMNRDAHAIDGKYLIRSLYFDNASDKVLREKIDGVNVREKFRIRYYNHDTSLTVVFLYSYRAYFVLIATTPRQFAFSFGIIQAVAAVAVFFFVYVGDPKHLLSSDTEN